ncbi:uncharacterized protein [Dermacentor albipictus]|uniref:uncharacterized protein isoform X2 n=1 Tax=Dermacentor albipictus TaxID=60249 RepID=UPI0038FC3F41
MLSTMHELETAKYYHIWDLALSALPVVDADNYLTGHGVLLLVYVVCSSHVVFTKATALKAVASKIAVVAPTVSKCISYCHGSFGWTVVLIVAAALKAMATQEAKKFVRNIRGGWRGTAIRALEEATVYHIGDVALSALPVVDADNHPTAHGALLLIYVACATQVAINKAAALKAVASKIAVAPPTVSKCISYCHGSFGWTVVLIVAAALKAMATQEAKKFVRNIRGGWRGTAIRALEEATVYHIGDVALSALPVVDADNHPTAHGALLLIYVACATQVAINKAAALKAVASKIAVAPPTVSKCISYCHGSFGWTVVLIVAAALKAMATQEAKKFVRNIRGGWRGTAIRALEEATVYHIGDVALSALPVVDADNHPTAHGALLLIYVACATQVAINKAAALKAVASKELATRFPDNGGERRQGHICGRTGTLPPASFTEGEQTGWRFARQDVTEPQGIRSSQRDSQTGWRFRRQDVTEPQGIRSWRRDSQIMAVNADKVT